MNTNLKNTGITLLGATFLIVAIFLVISLVSFNIEDPSFNQANSNQIKNLGGYYGAFIADPILQSLGFSALFLIMFLTSTGFKMVSRRETKYLILRLSFLFLFLPVFATLFAYLGAPSNPMFLSYGGFIGTFMKKELSLYFDNKYIILCTLFLAAIGTFITSNISLQEWKILFRNSAKIIMFLMKLLIRSVRSVILFIRRISTRKEEVIEVEFEKDNLPEDREFERASASAVIEIKNRTPKFEKRPLVQPSLKLDPNDFELPSTKFLKEAPLSSKKNQFNEASLNQNSKLLQQVLQDFGVNGSILSIRPGPVVTLYELEPAAGTKSSRVISLADDISRSMSAVSARIAIIPGKNALGIELPNAYREIVYLRELMEYNEYLISEAHLPLILGKNIGGEPVIADLTKMPHLLVAGTTGSGKSVAINTMILSLLYKLTPKECQFIMIDPKMLELSVYEGIPHLLTPVVTEPKKAVTALKWVVKEMENRYRAMSTLGVRNVQGFNKAIEEAKIKGQRLEKQIQTGFDRETGKPIFESIEMPTEKLPYIVVIVDEMADLMLVAGKDIEGYIQRLAQMARAAGIHIIMATQRPSVDVITGVIKANFPTRISFQVTSKIDSRTILGEQGAEQLLGMGDMLYMVGGGRIERVHGPFVGDREVETVVDFLKKQGSPKYREEIIHDDEEQEDFAIFDDAGDDLYNQAVAIVLRDKRPTTSYIQRCLKIGYNRAANLIEKMEKEGILSPPNHMGKRDILKE